MINGTQLSWDYTTDIVKLLIDTHSVVPLDGISLGELEKWVLELPQFVGEANLVNDAILLSILTERIEEV